MTTKFDELVAKLKEIFQIDKPELDFGIRANYMAKFKEYLELEIGRPLDNVLTLDFPIKHRSIPTGLKIPQVAEGYGLNQENGFKIPRGQSLVRQGLRRRL